jgi:small subunit ribosomal protein S3
MDAGARGCLIIISGKITGARHRVEKFQKGHIKFCGETALEFMNTGFSVCVKKLGTIGCTVRIMRKGVQLPHEIKIHERHEVGLDPIDEISMIEAPAEVEDTDSNDVAAEEVVDSVLQKMADIETNEEVQEEE